MCATKEHSQKSRQLDGAVAGRSCLTATVRGSLLKHWPASALHAIVIFLFPFAILSNLFLLSIPRSARLNKSIGFGLQVYLFAHRGFIISFCRGINFECIYKNGSLRIIITDIWHCMLHLHTHATLYSMRRLVVPLKGS